MSRLILMLTGLVAFFLQAAIAAAQQIPPVVDAATGIRLSIPARLLGAPRQSKFGSTWSASNGRLVVDTLKFTDRSLADLQTSLRNRPGRRITSEVGDSDRFELRGADSDRSEFHLKLQRDQDEVRGLSVVYHKEFTSAAQAIVRSVDLFPGAAAQRKSGVQARPISQESPELQVVPNAGRGSVEGASLTSGNKRILLNSYRTVALHDLPTGRLVRTYHTQDLDTHPSIHGSAMSAVADRVVAVNRLGNLFVWKASTGELLNKIEDGSYFHASHFSDDGSRWTTVHLGKIEVRDTISWKVIAKFGDDGDAPAVFSPDGRQVLLVNKDNSAIKLVDLAGRRTIRTFATKHTGTLAFSSDGKMAVSGGGSWNSSKPEDDRDSLKDAAVRIWNLATGESRLLSEGLSAIASVSFSPDGSSVLALNEDGSMRVWNASTGELLRSGAILNDANLQGTQLAKTNLEGATLIGCKIYGISA